MQTKDKSSVLELIAAICGHDIQDLSAPSLVKLLCTDLTLKPYHEKILQAFDSSSKRVVINKCRQCGATTMEVAWALCKAMANDNMHIIVASYTTAGVFASYKQFVNLCKNISMISSSFIDFNDNEHGTGATLINGSTIDFYTCNAISYEENLLKGVDCIIFDECAFMPNIALSIVLATMESLHPVAKQILVSTPNEASGVFFEKCCKARGTPDYLEISGKEVLSKAKFSAMTKLLSKSMIDREFLNKFSSISV